MTDYRDNYPYNIESAQKLLIQYSHAIDFNYSNGNYPSGNEEDWDWENVYIPVKHYIGSSIVEKHTYMRIKIGDKANWSYPIFIGENYFKIDISDKLNNLDNYKDENPGFTFYDVDNGDLYILEINGWSGPFPMRGEDGIAGATISGIILKEETASYLIYTMQISDGSEYDFKVYNGNNPIAQYSSDNIEWHDIFNADSDYYMRWSEDSGNTWTDAMVIRARETNKYYEYELQGEDIIYSALSYINNERILNVIAFKNINNFSITDGTNTYEIIIDNVVQTLPIDIPQGENYQLNISYLADLNPSLLIFETEKY